jgi:hypothetical protein
MHPTQSSTKKKKQTMPNPSPAPPPYYITSATPPAYCHTCGRVISSKRNTTTSSASKKPNPNPKTTPKFCSERCKRHKPSLSPTSAEVHVEKALIALLENRAPPPPYKFTAQDETETPPSSISAPRKKGESRVLLPLSILEEAVFGPRGNPERSYGRRRNRAFRGVREDGQWRSVDMEGDSGGERNGARPEPISTWEGAEDFEGDDLEIEGGVKLERKGWDDESEDLGGGGEAETEEMAAKRRAGQKKAEEREFVRCVVRRAVVFGIEVEGWEGVGGGAGSTKKGKRGKAKDAEADEIMEVNVRPRRKCEAVMSGQVVEPSFAKGDWSVRWRDE